jgi:hypothetical protein
MNWLCQHSWKGLEWIGGIWNDGSTFYNPDIIQTQHHQGHPQQPGFTNT